MWKSLANETGSLNLALPTVGQQLRPGNTVVHAMRCPDLLHGDYWSVHECAIT